MLITNTITWTNKQNDLNLSLNTENPRRPFVQIEVISNTQNGPICVHSGKCDRFVGHDDTTACLLLQEALENVFGPGLVSDDPRDNYHLLYPFVLQMIKQAKITLDSQQPSFQLTEA